MEVMTANLIESHCVDRDYSHHILAEGALAGLQRLQVQQIQFWR
jgi:hypothetical protein